ncbi:SET domain-containing protein [Meredithblackwellia eburnea MCA 4105]
MSLSQTKATAPCDSEVPGGGFGLILLERAKKDDYLLTYAGEVISNRANLSKAWEELPQRSLVSYEFGLNKSHTIDSVHIGGQGRFMNHSVADEDDESGWNGGQKRRTPNTVTRHSAVHQTHQVAFHAMNSLAAGTELTFNYGPEYPQEWK